jgi:hypothetical protein
MANLANETVSSRCAIIISSAFYLVMMCNTLNRNNTIGTGVRLVRRYSWKRQVLYFTYSKCRVQTTVLTDHLQQMNPDMRVMFTHVEGLFRLLLANPASPAISERSFSSLCRLETYLYSKYSQQQPNHLPYVTLIQINGIKYIYIICWQNVLLHVTAVQPFLEKLTRNETVNTCILHLVTCRFTYLL